MKYFFCSLVLICLALQSFPAIAEIVDQNRELPVLTIPVVVHVVWKNDEENISNEQIHSQIEVLNEAFRKRNSNLDIIPPLYQSRVADLEIEFCLAQSDPEGFRTEGITRTQTRVDNIGSATNEGRKSICYTRLGGRDAWDTEKYVNIWVGEMGNGLAGQASFPGQDNTREDGIRITPDRFGNTGTVKAPYHLGRTMVHEMGHYLNLQHLWGSCKEEAFCCSNVASDCDCDDGIEDTPPLLDTYLRTCPGDFKLVCGSPDMFMNYMTFADDPCMAMFTEGQKAVVLQTLNELRPGLLDGSACKAGIVVATQVQKEELLVDMFPNPASDILYFKTDSDHRKKIEIYDTNGTIVLQLKRQRTYA